MKSWCDSAACVASAEECALLVSAEECDLLTAASWPTES